MACIPCLLSAHMATGGADITILQLVFSALAQVLRPCPAPQPGDAVILNAANSTVGQLVVQASQIGCLALPCHALLPILCAPHVLGFHCKCIVVRGASSSGFRRS